MKYLLTDKTYIHKKIFNSKKEAEAEKLVWENYDRRNGEYMNDRYIILPGTAWVNGNVWGYDEIEE